MRGSGDAGISLRLMVQEVVPVTHESQSRFWCGHGFPFLNLSAVEVRLIVSNNCHLLITMERMRDTFPDGRLDLVCGKFGVGPSGSATAWNRRIQLQVRFGF